MAEQLAENVAAQVLAIAKDYSHLLFPATAHGKNVAPRVAALLDVAQISDATKIVSADTFERPIYAGNAIAHGAERRSDQGDHRTHHRLRRRSVDQRRQRRRRDRCRQWPTAACRASSVPRSPSSTGPELTAAKIIVSGGRAMGSSDKFNEVLTPLADKLGAALGCQPRRGRCGLRAQRLAGGPDRQDRGAAAVHRLRHLAARSSTWPA